MRAWPALALLLSACGDADVKRIEVGGHVFTVPEANVETATLPFLPPPEHPSLMARLNPEAPLPEQKLVLVQTIAAACSPTAVGEQQRETCAVARGQDPAPEPIGALRKVARHADDPTQYDYRDADGHVVLMCSANTDGTGACDMSFAWRDLIWSVDLPESEVDRAEQLRAEISRRLDEWSAGG